MSQQSGRYSFSSAPSVNEGWQLSALTHPSRLFGANGLRTGADGRVYVAQVSGSQISAIDVDTGVVETISPKGGEIVAPDDIVFDDQGNLFATEITESRVSMLTPRGESRVICGEMPCANPITMYQGRLFAGECRVGGRIMELDIEGGPPRVILQDVPMPNAMEVGPDGKLYIPIMGTNEIWRVSLEGGAPEVVAKDLGVPDSVKFDREGFIVSTQVASGQVLRINPANGEKTVLATIAPGLDNCTFVGDRIIVSSISGQVNEILADGKVRSVVPDGLNWPLGLTVSATGDIFIADGGFTYQLSQGSAPRCIGHFFTEGYPGYIRGITLQSETTFIVTTSNGTLARWNPAAQSHEVLSQEHQRLYGVAVSSSGAIYFADAETGQVFQHVNGSTNVIAANLMEPIGVAVSKDDEIYVAEEGAGRVIKVAAGKQTVVIDQLQKPQGLEVVDGQLFVLDAGAKSLICVDLSTNKHSTIAQNLPVGAPTGIVPKFLKAIPPLAGPMGPFADVVSGGDGILYLSGDADGTVLALKKR